jgi:GTPase SAR1 family protein
MKRGLRSFKLEMPTKMRTPRFAEEVATPTGIVDVIRFEDYISEDKSFCLCIDYFKLPEDEQKRISTFISHLGECKLKGLSFPNEKCQSCVWKSHFYNTDILITCYECKISVSDFKSPNGHNFHGHKNYYVVPKNIVKQIESLVPDDIGIIVYYEKSETYRIYKECKTRNIDEKLKTRLLYDAFKKWVDKFQTQY